MDSGVEWFGEMNPTALAVYLRGAAIELLQGQDLEPKSLAILLEAAAADLLNGEDQRRGAGSSSGAERLAQIKAQHSNAYEPWTAEDDASLRQMHSEGCSTAELAEVFQRQPSATTRT